jgi:hypothetical protein
MKHRNKQVSEVRSEHTPTVSARAFIEAWQSSATVAEVARRVGRTKNAVRVRAFRFREWYDIPLKYFPPVELELNDWDELRAFAESFETIGESPTAIHGVAEGQLNELPQGMTVVDDQPT